MLPHLKKSNTYLFTIHFRYLTSKIEKIDRFFPANDNKTILEFLSNDDGRFEERSNAFAGYLNGVADPNGTNYKKFSDLLKNLLFHREYMETHRWVFTK